MQHQHNKNVDGPVTEMAIVNTFTKLIFGDGAYTGRELLIIQAFRAVDANVGRLAGLLRMAGFDAFYARHLPDRELAALAALEQRVLLTRDFALLKRREVVFWRLVRRRPTLPHI